MLYECLFKGKELSVIINPLTRPMRFLTWLIVASVVFRGLIPAGYMPGAPEAGHVFKVVICTGYGSQTMVVDDHGQPIKKDSKHSKNHKIPCPFALNTHATTPSVPVAQVGMAVVYTDLLFPAPAAHPATAMLRKTAPARAPPLFS